MTDDIQKNTENEVKSEEQEPEDVVIVLACRSTDGGSDGEFAKFVGDIKALYTFKDDVRVYAVFDQAARNVLAKVEKPQESSNQAVLVVSFAQPDDLEDAPQKMKDIADTVRPLFENQPDVKVRVAIREVADEVIGAFGGVIGG